MKQLLKDNAGFYFPYAFFLLIGALSIMFGNKGSEIIWINARHTPLLDQTFVTITKLAEGPAFLLMFLVILFGGYGRGLILLHIYGVVAGVVQLLKHFVFENELRPALYMTSHALRFPDGIDVLQYHSFPSGHTALGFALFLSLAIISKNKLFGFVFFILALAVGASRVYLLQHFFRDIYFGSLIAVCITTLAWHYIPRTKFYQNITWKDKSLLSNA